MKPRMISTPLLILAVALLLPGAANAQFTLSRSRFGSGGLTLANDRFNMFGSAGQALAGESSGAFQLQAPDVLPVPLAPTVALGDVNNDGAIDIADAALIMMFIVGLEIPTDAQKAVADVDRDGALTAGDTILIFRRALGLIVAFTKPAVLADIPDGVLQAPEVARQKDGTVAVRLNLGDAGEIAAGELRLVYGFKGHPAEVRVEGLSAKGLIRVNPRPGGEMQIGFVRPAGDAPLVLHLLLRDIAPSEPLRIALTGRLYGPWGLPSGAIRLAVGMGYPSEYALDQNFPNPFNPATTIRYDLPKAGRVVMRVYDAAGRLVRELVNKHVEPGRHSVVWDGQGADGRLVASGIYFYRLEVDGGRFSAVQQMVMLK